MTAFLEDAGPTGLSLSEFLCLSLKYLSEDVMTHALRKFDLLPSAGEATTRMLYSDSVVLNIKCVQP